MDGKKPIVEAESHFLDLRADLVSLSSLPEQNDGNEVLENWVERKWGHTLSTKVGLLPMSPYFLRDSPLFPAETSKPSTCPTRSTYLLLFKDHDPSIGEIGLDSDCSRHASRADICSVLRQTTRNQARADCRLFVLLRN